MKMTLDQAVEVLDKLSPAGKRKALLKQGTRTEYLPHQGKRELARRLRQEAKRKADQEVVVI